MILRGIYCFWMILLLIPALSISQMVPDESGIGQVISQLYEEEKFHGGILVAEGRQILYYGVRGKANRKNDESLRTEHRFSINSLGKMFTAILILQLVDEGKLSTEDSLSKILPEFTHPRSSEITIHHLLSHRSGILDYFMLMLDGKLDFELDRGKCLMRL